MATDKVQLVVSAVRQLGPRVRELLLKAPDGSPLPAWEAGAHVELRFDAGDGALVRHYSLVGGDGNDDDGRGAWRIAVQRAERARGSAHLHEHVAVGTRLEASHPRNDFRLDRRDGKSLLIAGGIGITPILAMARSLARRRRDFEVVYAGRSRHEMAYAADLEQLAGARVRIHDADRHGGARVDLNTLLAAQPARTTAYVCGPASMIEDCRKAAAASGWDAARVRSELFTPPPTGDEVGFELVLATSGRTIRVGPHSSILEAMTAAGLHPLYGCGRGECGLCPLPVLEADGPLQHRDTYLSGDEKAAGNSLCICVSRVSGPRLVLAA